MTKQKMIMAAICFGTIFAISTPCTGLQKILSKAQITACAADSTKGTYGNLSYTNYGTYIKITGCSANATEEKIPAEINGIPVTTIGNYAFSYCDNLTSVIIPNGVTSIGTYAFCWCEKLAAVHIPNTVKTIGSGAFNHCQSLVSAAIPDGVTTLEAEVFSGCESMTSITIPDSVTSIGNSAFSICSNLTSVILPDGVTSIGDYAFSYCYSLTSITIPDSVTSIEKNAFYLCEKLEDVYYTGSKEEWSSIEIDTEGGGNDTLLNAIIHYDYVIPANTNPGVNIEDKTDHDDNTGTLTIGDVNGDGKITIHDAYITLLAYSKLSAGLDSGLTDVQVTVADVNADGKITITDAYNILLYYATKSAGGTPSWN